MSNSTETNGESGNSASSFSANNLATQLILLSQRWKMILVSTVAGTILAAGLALFLAFTHQTVYKLNAYIVPPQQGDIQSLTAPLLLAQQVIWSPRPQAWNPDLPRLPTINVKAVYHEFERVLISREMQDRFSNQKYSPIRFVIRKESSDTITLILFTHEPESAKQWIRDYTNHTNQTVIDNFASDLRQGVNDRLMLLDHTKRSMEHIHKQRIADHVAQLEEALDVATALNISDRIDQSPLPPAAVPLYYRGSNFLRAEIQAIKERRTHEAFYWTIHLREIEEWSEKLRQITINTTDTLAARVQISSYAPPEPLKPRPIVIFWFGLAIALSLGVVAASVSNFIGRTRS